ncbi:hypothetical protein MSKU15_3521 [Komagataeibacter diospyri]|nr:hypothetical protein MSKU15_3521 [Komagataeibacter diospyri]
MATGNVNLNAVTDSQSSYTRTVEHGFLNRTTTTSSESSTDQVGSTVAANDNVTMVSGRDMSVAGTVAGGGNVTLQAGGTFTENALKDTANAFYEQKSSGLFLGTSGASARIGFGKTTDTDTYSQTTWNPREIASTGGNLSITANGPVTINASDLGAAKDATVTGSSVSFNALEDVATQTQTHKSLFIGQTTGLDPNSVVGQMVDIALSASQASGKDSGRLAGLDGAAAAGMGAQVGLQASKQVKSVSSLFEKGDSAKGNIDLIAVQSNIGFDLEKSSTTLTTGTVQGSTAAAGNTLAVTATGGVPTDSQSGNIVATASQLSGQDVILTAPGAVTLQAGYDTTHEVASSKSISASVGASASIGTKGAGVSIEGQFGFSKSNTNAASSTAVDSTVSGTDTVTLANATGTTTLNGAEISGKSIDVATKDLTIATAQDTSGYNSKTTGIDASFSVPVWGAGDIGGSASFSHTTVRDSYASTEATQSGLYAGSGGLDVTASGTTTLNGGVIESTAAASQNHLTTDTLVANDIANHADATAKTMGYQANVMNPEGATGGGTGRFATAIGAGMAANAGGLLGAATRKDASSVTQSAIGSNVQIAAGSTSGDLSRSPATSSHPLTNTFDARQMQNDLQIQQVGSQVVGQVGGMVADTLHSKGVAGFDETNWKDNYGRILMEAAGNAGVAALGHGNVAAAGIGTASAGIATSAILPSAAAWAVRQSDNLDTEIALTNIITNTIASAAGAAGGLAAGGSTSIDALTGAAAASAIQQNNMSQQMAEFVAAAQIAAKVLERVPRPVAKAIGITLGASAKAFVEYDSLMNLSSEETDRTVNAESHKSSERQETVENDNEARSRNEKTAAPGPDGEDPKKEAEVLKGNNEKDSVTRRGSFRKKLLKMHGIMSKLVKMEVESALLVVKRLKIPPILASLGIGMRVIIHRGPIEYLIIALNGRTCWTIIKRVYLLNVRIVIVGEEIMTNDSKNELPLIFEHEFGDIQLSMLNTIEKKVQIIKYKKKFETQFVSTLGLSNVLNNKNIKSEWFMEFDGDLASENAASVLDYYVSMLIEGNIPFTKRGSFIIFPKKTDHIWLNDNICGIYFTLPVYRSEEFQVNMIEIGIFAIWVVPITNSEKYILENKGWSYLEDYWDDNNINLHNPFR